MDSTDLVRLERRVRLRYESGRIRRAVLGLLPVLVITALAAWLGGRPREAIVFGSVVFVWGALLLWYGREPRRAVLPGIAAGLVPLTFAICANLVEHGCAGSACVRVCIPACAVGGLVAGLTVAAIGRRRRHGAAFWLSASGIALLTGAMGCACMGYSGVVGMVFGFGAGLVASAVRRLLDPGR